MTVNDARKQVEETEADIDRSFRKMREEAYYMSKQAADAAHEYTIRCTMIPLIACLIGLFCCMASSWGWGIVLIIGGAVVAYKMHASAAAKEDKIKTAQQNLDNTLKRYTKI